MRFLSLLASTVASAIVTVGAGYYMFTNDYGTPKPVHVVLLDKFTAGLQSRIQATFAVKEIETGQSFDIDVSLATYSQFNKGDRITFTMRDENVPSRRNGLLFTAHILSALAFLMGILITFNFAWNTITKALSPKESIHEHH
jgi:hypothetical protein